MARRISGRGQYEALRPSIGRVWFIGGHNHGVLPAEALGPGQSGQPSYTVVLTAPGWCKAQLGLSLNTARNGTKYPYFFCLGRHGHRKNGCQMPYVLMELVESYIEEMWSRVRLPASELDAIRSDVSGLINLAAVQHETDLAVQRVRLDRLAAEEAKLLQAHYAEAISLQLLQSEQKRIRDARVSAESRIEVG